MNTNIFDKISFWSLFLVITLLPIFILPFTKIPLETAKGVLLVSGLVISLVSWAMARFSDGKIVVAKSPLLLSSFIFTLVLFFSAFLSKNSSVSLFGSMLDVGSFWFMLGSFVLMFLSSVTFKDNKRVTLLIIGVAVSSLLVFIFQGLYLFVPKFLSLGIFTGKTENVIGSWRSLGFFAGFASILSLFIIEFLSVSKVVKFILGVLLFLAISFVAITSPYSMSLLWGVVGLFSLVIFVYKASISYENHPTEGVKMHFPVISFTVVTLAILFFMSGHSLGSPISNRLHITSNEVSPSIKATILVTKSVLQNNPVLGIGPNRFGEAWALYKPISVNSTPLSDVIFNSSFGFIPTILATIGGLGILSFLLFVIVFLFSGVRSVFFSIKKGVNYLMILFFVVALYLFVSSFFYPIGFVLIALAYAFTGVFIGFSGNTSSKNEISLYFLSDHRKSFFVMLVLIFIMISSVAVLVKYGERFMSVVYFERSLTTTVVNEAESSIVKAISLYPNDLYLRTLSQISLIKLNSIVSKGEASLTEDDKAQAKSAVDQAVGGAQLAVSYNSNNYLNYQMLGSVYQNMASLGVKDANAKALEVYISAAKLNPLNPKIKLTMATIAFASGNKDGAKSYANEALSLKPDYGDALIALSQIAKSEGDNVGALSYAEKALAVSPNNNDYIKYVESLKTSNKISTTSKDGSTEKDTKKKQ